MPGVGDHRRLVSAAARLVAPGRVQTDPIRRDDGSRPGAEACRQFAGKCLRCRQVALRPVPDTPFPAPQPLKLQPTGGGESGDEFGQFRDEGGPEVVGFVDHGRPERGWPTERRARQDQFGRIDDVPAPALQHALCETRQVPDAPDRRRAEDWRVFDHDARSRRDAIVRQRVAGRRRRVWPDQHMDHVAALGQRGTRLHRMNAVGAFQRKANVGGVQDGHCAPDGSS